MKAPPIKPDAANGADTMTLFNSWQKRLCTLGGSGILSWYSDATKTTLKGSLDLREVQRFQPNPKTERAHCFSLVTELRAFYFCAESDAEKARWVAHTINCLSLLSPSFVCDGSDAARDRLRDRLRVQWKSASGVFLPWSDVDDAHVQEIAADAMDKPELKVLLLSHNNITDACAEGLAAVLGRHTISHLSDIILVRDFARKCRLLVTHNLTH